MNYKHQENGALTGPLIFTVPASHFQFLVALSFGWLDVTERSAEEKRRTHNLTVATQRLFRRPPRFVIADMASR
jgi:hypothetical protein